MTAAGQGMGLGAGRGTQKIRKEGLNKIAKGEAFRFLSCLLHPPQQDVLGACLG